MAYALRLGRDGSTCQDILSEHGAQGAHVQVEVREVRQRQQRGLHHLAVLLRQREADLLLRPPRQALQEPPPQVVTHLTHSQSRAGPWESDAGVSRHGDGTDCEGSRAGQQLKDFICSGPVVGRHWRWVRRADVVGRRGRTCRTSAGHRCPCNVTCTSSLRQRCPAVQVRRELLAAACCFGAVAPQPRAATCEADAVRRSAVQVSMRPPFTTTSRGDGQRGLREGVPVRVMMACSDRQTDASASELCASTRSMIDMSTSAGSSSSKPCSGA